ncbi:MAG: hypothetical protein ACJ744_06040 [Gaiellaceae bacterium]
MQRDVAPPSGGTPPPATVQVRGESIHLAPLAHEICRRFLLEFPDDRERYGDAALAWCVHDNQWLLGWAAEDLDVGGKHFANNVRWLARVLRARDYPTERLVRDLELAAEVVGAESEAHRELADKLLQGAKLLSRR